jgi:hypothetical protein
MNGPVVALGLLRVLAVLALVTRRHVHDLSAVIRATRRANAVRKFQFLALTAHFQRGRLQIVVSPAAITAPFRMFAFW